MTDLETLKRILENLPHDQSITICREYFSRFVKLALEKKICSWHNCGWSLHPLGTNMLVCFYHSFNIWKQMSILISMTLKDDQGYSRLNLRLPFFILSYIRCLGSFFFIYSKYRWCLKITKNNRHLVILLIQLINCKIHRNPVGFVLHSVNFT